MSRLKSHCQASSSPPRTFFTPSMLNASSRPSPASSAKSRGCHHTPTRGEGWAAAEEREREESFEASPASASWVTPRSSLSSHYATPSPSRRAPPRVYGNGSPGHYASPSPGVRSLSPRPMRGSSPSPSSGGGGGERGGGGGGATGGRDGHDDSYHRQQQRHQRHFQSPSDYDHRGGTGGELFFTSPEERRRRRQ
jgi:hypothetical protein